MLKTFAAHGARHAAVLLSAFAVESLLAAESTWTGNASDQMWSTAGNWSPEAVPDENTIVTFPDFGSAYTVKITGNHGDQDFRKCAAVVVNGDVTIARGANSWTDIIIYGANAPDGDTVSGSGKLTLNMTGLYLASGDSITIACDFVGDGGNDNAFVQVANNAQIIFKNPVTVRATSGGHFRPQGGDATFQSTVTIEGNARLRNSANPIELQGEVTVAAGGNVLAQGALIRFANGFTLTNGRTMTAGAGGGMISGSAVSGAFSGSPIALGSSGNSDSMAVENGTVTSSEDMLVGDGGSATLTIRDGGTVVVRNGTQKKWLKLNGGNGTINLDAGGVLEVSSIRRFNNPSTAVINFNGGTLKAWAVDGGVINDAETVVNVLAGGAIIDVDAGVEASVKTSLLKGVTDGDDGGLTKKGDGALLVEVIPTYAGTTKVEAGALYLPEGYTPTLEETVAVTSDKSGYKKYVKNEFVAKATINGEEQRFLTLGAALAALNGAAGEVTLLTDCAGENVSLAEGQSIVTAGFAIGSVTTTVTGYVAGIADGIYRLYADTTPVYWTGEGNTARWDDKDNWSLGFVPLATTPVTFNSDAIVGLSGNTDDTHDKCALLTINGNVTFQPASSWVKLYVHGNIAGNGTMTLNNACLQNANVETASEISCRMAVVGTGDSAMIGLGGWTISGGLTINGYFKVQNGTVNVTCAAEIASGATIDVWATLNFVNATIVNGNFTYIHGADGAAVTFGAVTVAESTTIPNSADITLNGAVTVDAGKTLTMPAGRVTIGENAAFTLAGAGAKIVDGTGSLAGVTCSTEATEGGYTAVKINDAWVAAVTWTGAANDGGKWATVGNWSNNAVPGNGTPIAFTTSAVVDMGSAARNCEGMYVASGVSVEIIGGTTKCDVNLYGHVAGSGTLTLTGSGLKNRIAGTTLLVAPNVVFQNAPGVENNPQPWLAGGAITVNGNVTFVDEFKAWDTTHTIAGTTTFSGPTFKLVNGDTLALGAVNTANSVAVTVTGGTLTFNGKTSIAGGKTLEIPAERVAIGGNATFELADFGAKLVDNGGLVAEEKVTTPITKGAKIAITTEGSKKTYKLSPVGLMIILR
ncbi:MAG: hypothetical protein IKQ17_07900 [Kiritimatiellae bacterium]|nr:hypothetical protein [Kiritimatiellia bacterium]